MKKYKILIIVPFLFHIAFFSSEVRAQKTATEGWHQIEGWSDLSYLYDAPRNLTFVSLRPQRVALKQNEDVADVNMKVLFIFSGTMADLKANPALPKQYNLHFTEVPSYAEGIVPLKFARLTLFSRDFGDAQQDLPLVEAEQLRGDILRGVQVMEFVLGDIQVLLPFSLADDALLETSAGVVRLRASDLRYAGAILRYTTTLLEKQQREKSKRPKSRKAAPKKNRKG